MPDSDIKASRKDMSRIGLALFAMIAAAAGSQFLIAKLTAPLSADMSWLRYLLLFGVQYAIAMPLAVLIIKGMPAFAPGKSAVTARDFFIFILVCFAAMWFGSLAGRFVSWLISALAGRGMSDIVQDVITGAGFWVNLVTVVIAAPVAEELFYRKLLIGRLSVYGSKAAIFTSALIFGLMHGNFSQFFYAFALGLVFGYIYVRTGRVIYTIALHMTVNFFGGVLAPLAISSGIGFQALYGLAVLGMAIAGFVLFIVNVKRATLSGGERSLKPASYFNIGMILFFLGCAALFVLNTYSVLIIPS